MNCSNFFFLFIWKVSYTRTQWVLNPQPYPPPNTYTGRSANWARIAATLVQHIIFNPVVTVLFLSLLTVYTFFFGQFFGRKIPPTHYVTI